MSDESIKARIRKLLALAADDGAAENEINVALATAQRLMQQHRLNESDVATDSRSPEEIAKETKYGQVDVWAEGEKFPPWQGTLCMCVSDFIGTIGAYQRHAQIKRDANGLAKRAPSGEPIIASAFVFYGPPEDCELAADLLKELIVTVTATAQLKWGGNGFRGSSRAYAIGFASGLYGKIKESKKVLIAEQPQTGTALAIIRSNELVAAKRRHADEWLKKEQKVKLSRGGGYSWKQSESEAYESGRADGRSTELTANRTRKLTAR